MFRREGSKGQANRDLIDAKHQYVERSHHPDDATTPSDSNCLLRSNKLEVAGPNQVLQRSPCQPLSGGVIVVILPRSNIG